MGGLDGVAPSLARAPGRCQTAPVIRTALLAIAALALSLVICELAVRFLHLAPEVTRVEIHTPWAAFVPSESPILQYEPKPGAGDVNAYGARDFPFAVEKPPGTFRIVVIGDSIAFGFCNEDAPLAIEDTFAKVLERSLRQRVGRPLQVINLAVSGYDTVQEAEMLARKGIPLHPDLVVVAYCLNDAWDASVEQIAFESRFGGLLGSGNAFRSLYLSSDLLRLVMQRTQIVRRGIRWARGQLEPDRTRRGFARIARLGEEHGFTTVVATFPMMQDFDHYGRLSEHTAVADKAAAAGLRNLDLLPAFREAAAGDFRTLQGRCNREHPDEAGHAVAARAIEAYLLEQTLIDEVGR